MPFFHLYESSVFMLSLLRPLLLFLSFQLLILEFSLIKNFIYLNPLSCLMTLYLK